MERPQPLCSGGQRSREIPSDQDEGQRSDQERLQKGGEERIAKRERNAVFDVGSVINDDEGAARFGVAVERQGVGVERVSGDVKELTGTHIEFRGSIGGGGARAESVRKPWSDRQRGPEAIVDRNAEEMLALAKPLDDALEVFVVGASRKRFETLLKALGERGGAARQIIAEIAALRAHLVGGVKKGDANDTYGERQHKFQCGAHAEASERDERIPDNLLAGPAPRILRERKCASGWAGLSRFPRRGITSGESDSINRKRSH